MTPRAGQVQALIAAAIVGVGAFVLWRAWRAGKSLTESAQQVVEQAQADAQQFWNNNFVNPLNGIKPEVTTKTLLYSDKGYTGNDEFGAPVISGDWYANEEARRYEYQQREAGAAPAATSINGAAFGIYPSAGRRRPKPDATIGAPIPSP
jgi:hypothetical protein